MYLIYLEVKFEGKVALKRVWLWPVKAVRVAWAGQVKWSFSFHCVTLARQIKCLFWINKAISSCLFSDISLLLKCWFWFDKIVVSFASDDKNFEWTQKDRRQFYWSEREIPWSLSVPFVCDQTVAKIQMIWKSHWYGYMTNDQNIRRNSCNKN